MQFICQICNESIEYKNQYGICKISKHLLDKHNITAQDYYNTYIDTTSHVCKICGKDVKFLSICRGYAHTCSTRCARLYSARCMCTALSIGDARERSLIKLKQTKLEKYGDENYCNIDKCRQTCLQRYGVTCSLQSKQVKEHVEQRQLEKYGIKHYTNREKCRQTMLERYGVEYNWQSDKVKEKIRNVKLQKYNDEYYTNREKCHQTTLDRYGVDYIFQLPGTKEKIKQTNLQKYGVEHNWQREDVKEKIKQTCLKKYGVTNYVKNPELRKLCQKRYTYHDISFDSSAELAYYIWLTEHNIQFEYQPNIQFEYYVNNKIHIYEPDFKVENEYIEIKGLQFFEDKNGLGKMINPYDRTQDELYEAKHQCMLKNHVKIITDYQQYVDYVSSKYTSDYLKLFKNNLQFPYPDSDIISKYHHSIYDAHRNGYLSPREAWNDKNLIEKSALNRLQYAGSCKSNDILRGFSVAKIAPKVSVFKQTLAKRLIDTYMSDVREIFDPFSGFSGRMLGTCECNKHYIGQDINQTHVEESQNIINDFNLNATVECKDIFNSTRRI